MDLKYWKIPEIVTDGVDFCYFGHASSLRLLRGLSAKNAILIIEFAKDYFADGRSLLESAVDATKVRFRPTIMTSLAFALGVVPLAIATGPSAASQNAIGTGVLGGMISATVLAIFFVPAFFVFVLKLFRTKPQTNDEKHAQSPKYKPETEMQHQQ